MDLSSSPPPTRGSLCSRSPFADQRAGPPGGRAGGGDWRCGRKVPGDPATVILPCTSAQSHYPGSRDWCIGPWKVRVHVPAAGPGVTGRAPGAPGSRRVPAKCLTLPASRPSGVGVPAGAGSGPRVPPPPVNYAGGWHRRAGVAQVSLGNFGPGIPSPGGRAAPPAAQELPQGDRGEGACRETPTTHLHRSWAPLDRASRCDPPEGLAAGVGGFGAAPRWVCAGWEGRRAARGLCFRGARGTQSGFGMEASAPDRGSRS